MKQNTDSLGLNSQERTKYENILLREFDESDEAFDEDTLNGIHEFLNEVIYKKQQDLKGFNESLKQQNTEISQNAQAVFERSLGYNKLNDNQKKIGNQVFNNLQWDKVTTEYGAPVYTEEEAEQYIQNFAKKLSKLDGKDLLELDKLFSLNYEDMPIDEAKTTIEQYLTSLSEKFGMTPEQLKDFLGFGYFFKLSERYDNVVSYAADSKGFNRQDVVKAMKDNSINTDEEINKFKEILENATSLEDAIKSYVSSADMQTDITPLSFSKAWDSIGTSGNEKADKSAKEAKEKLLELARAGKLTKEEFQKSSIADQFLKDTKLSAEEATQKVNGLISSTERLSSMKDGISSISSILSQKEENQSDKKTKHKGISQDTLAGMPDDMKAQTKEYEHFVNVLGNGKSKMSDCKDAANKLATAYINSNNFLANLTDGTEGYYISILEEMGVENAASIAQEARNKQKITETKKSFQRYSYWFLLHRLSYLNKLFQFKGGRKTMLKKIKDYFKLRSMKKDALSLLLLDGAEILSAFKDIIMQLEDSISNQGSE